MRFALLAFSAILATTSAYGQKADPPEQVGQTTKLESAGGWQVAYEEEVCRISRNFVSGEDKHLLIMEQRLPNHFVDIMIAGPEMEGFDEASVVQVRFSKEPSPRDENFRAGSVEGFGQALVIQSLPFEAVSGLEEVDNPAPRRPFGSGIDLNYAAEINQITIGQSGKEVLLATGNMRAVLEVMNDCTHGLLATWGIDSDVSTDVVEGVRPKDLQQWSRRIGENYPTKALRKGIGGRVGVLVKVDKRGKVNNCRVVAGSGSDLLDDAACRGMTNYAKFEPALDAQGEPVPSFYVTQISYSVSEPVPATTTPQ